MPQSTRLQTEQKRDSVGAFEGIAQVMDHDRSLSNRISIMEVAAAEEDKLYTSRSPVRML